MNDDKKRWKRGDVHPDTGMVFIAYDKTAKNGEYWGSQAKLDSIRERTRARDRERSKRPDVRAKKKAYMAAYAKLNPAPNKGIGKGKWKRIGSMNAEERAAYNLAWKKRKMREDPLFKAQYTIRSAAQRAVKRGMTRPNRSIDILGCNIVRFKQHIESQFKPGMTWENHGRFGWHVDHIIPLSWAKDSEDLRNLSHYTNLQPLWWRDNLTKWAKT